MTLGWKVPRFSGGAPILGYFVDRREAQHRDWHEVNSAPVQERVLTVGAPPPPPPGRHVCSHPHAGGPGGGSPVL